MKKEKTTQPEHGNDVLLIRIKNLMPAAGNGSQNGAGSALMPAT
jgi:hypothetical protein